eukprot:TRINITY_DN14633_c0_g1_i1.p1 TRINITY_DN14633_c0_g1~~TRINITY_DN14633_c0_g1_i1.p1  ORF type:complete len:133 (+),score=38.26 TRINITY_DN14633_c0_g1_i1:90-488(+)
MMPYRHSAVERAFGGGVSAQELSRRTQELDLQIFEARQNLEMKLGERQREVEEMRREALTAAQRAQQAVGEATRRSLQPTREEQTLMALREQVEMDRRRRQAECDAIQEQMRQVLQGVQDLGIPIQGHHAAV